jgi:alanine dehydrogenase
VKYCFVLAPLWISEADVVGLVDLPQAISALEKTLRLEPSGEAENMTKTVVTFNGHDTLHAIGAAVPGAGFVGTKTWTHTTGGTGPLVILFDAKNGSVLAVIEAFALGQLRTAGISAVATNRLARPDARVMTIVGSGKQALPQVAAVLAVREIREVRVFSPTPANRAALVAKLKSTFPGVEAVDVANADEAFAGTDVITLATRATSPVLSVASAPRGVHVNAVGAIVPERAEFDPQLLKRCAIVSADSVPQTQNLSREFVEYYGKAGAPAWDAVVPLSRLVASDAGRPEGADVTLFKAMGMGISDLALGIEVHELARQRGLGREIPPRTNVPIRYHSAVKA